MSFAFGGIGVFFCDAVPLRLCMLAYLRRAPFCLLQCASLRKPARIIEIVSSPGENESGAWKVLMVGVGSRLGFSTFTVHPTIFPR